MAAQRPHCQALLRHRWQGVRATSADALLAHALEALDAFFGTRPAHLVAQLHGGDKLSFRIYVPGYRMRMVDIKERIVSLRLDTALGGPFDAAVYSKRQKLRMVGSIKTQQDRRALQPLDGTTPGFRYIVDTLVQVVDDAWPLLPAATRQDKKITSFQPAWLIRCSTQHQGQLPASS